MMRELLVATLFAMMVGRPMTEPLSKYISLRVAEFDQIPADRKRQLEPLVTYIRGKSVEGVPVRLTFICTHNSRRSHLSQIWASAAASHYGVTQVETFSGGTEATALNPRAVAALRRAGFEIPEPTEVGNPRYSIRFLENGDPLVCFSKNYQDKPNPASEFAAVMTCSQADEACPVVPGAEARISLPYDDPKASDSTPQEQETYDERTAQIARELLYVFHEVAKSAAPSGR